MQSIWYKPELAEEIINNEDIFESTQNIVSDIISGRIDITKIVENMAGVLTHKEAEHREKGMRFFTKILKDLPSSYLSQMQMKFISKFYIDRLNDNHRVIPAVLDGFLVILNMDNYDIQNSAEFFTILFREIPCQSQVRQDRFNIYSIIQKAIDKGFDYTNSLGPDFVYGVISSMDGERDPRNLLFLFTMLQTFIKQAKLGHLVEEMFEVISCYYPIDFNPAADDPAAVTRQDLASALTPCLCAIPEFGEPCLILLIEKLDSALRLAKIDSLKLLTASCQTFKAEAYGPFLRTLSASIKREITQKTDEELKMAAHEALSALIAKLATTADTDQAFENFVKGIMISMQTVLAEATTVSQFVQTTRVLLTMANASKESCFLITRTMIPAIVAYYGFKTSAKLQIASIEFFGDMYALAVHWGILAEIDDQVKEIPQLCLTAISEPNKEYQIAGFKTLIRTKDILPSDLVLPFLEVLIYNIKHSQENDLLSVCVETVHAIARKYPELIMSIVVKGKCNLENMTNNNAALQKRLNLLCNLASIDDFTKIIIEEMLKILVQSDKEASNVVVALSDSMMNTNLYPNEKVAQIESDHGLIDSIITWILKEIPLGCMDTLQHGCTLISNTMSSLPGDKQKNTLFRHTSNIYEKCKENQTHFLVLESLYNSLQQSVYDSDFEDIMYLCLNTALYSDVDFLRTRAGVLIANFLNKAEHGQKFELLYEVLKIYLANCASTENIVCSRLIELYAWVAKALIMRGSDIFKFWLQKIVMSISSPLFCKQGSEAVKIIMTDYPNYLTHRQHCRVSLLYKQRMFQAFAELTESMPPIAADVKEAYLLSWAYILEKVPRSVLNNHVNKVAPLLTDALEFEDKDLLLVMVDILCYFVQTKHASITHSLQTILPKLINLSEYVKSMDVRIKSLQCLYEIAESYSTAMLLPYKQDILIDLAPSLDDKKRLVRNMAVRARTRWFLVGSPGENKEN